MPLNRALVCYARASFFTGLPMDEIKKAIDTYEEIRKYKYHIAIENGIAFDLLFGKHNFHHLIGLQHLTDKPRIAEPMEPQKKFYNTLAVDAALREEILSSRKYKTIKERIENFDRLVDILRSGDARIIVAFDPGKTPTQTIEAKFMLFDRAHNPGDGDADIVYYHLFLDDSAPSKYCPITYIVEHSKMYMNGQVLLDCSITQIPLVEHSKKKCRRIKPPRHRRGGEAD